MTPRRHARVVLALVAVGATVAGVVAWRSVPPAPPAATPQPVIPPIREPEPPPVDPRVAFPTEFRNVRPEVKYVGDAACARCHEPIARTYHEHPMGRSAEWIGRGPTGTDHAAGPNNPFTTIGYSLRVERKGDAVRHLVGVADAGKDSPVYDIAADLAIGSGTHGRSYLTVDRGAVWQSPISWFSQAGKWDVSPGFDLAKELRRPIVAQCLRCHTNHPEPVANSLNRYREPLSQQAHIGCERCHGPGELHVAVRDRGESPKPDFTIVHPGRLDAPLKADVCRQCHLQGATQITRRGRDATEYRPGLPWEQFVSTFLWHPDITDFRKSVGQFEQMETSRCFTASSGKMSCTSCHNPHFKPAAKDTPAYFRNKCLTCHESRGCSLPVVQRVEKNDSCIACHMPARDSSNVTHVAVTDHRIMRRPDSGQPRAKVLGANQMPLVPYVFGPHAPDGSERNRDYAIALGNEFTRGGASPDRLRAAELALERSLERWPNDGTAWLTLSRVHGVRGASARAVEAARSAVALNANSEVALIQLAGVEIAAEDFVGAARTAESLIALNPSSADHRLTRATAYFSLKDWAKAEEECRASLTIQPVRPSARFMLAVCLHKRGAAAAGRQELDLALKLTPAPEMRTQLTAWYEQFTR